MSSRKKKQTIRNLVIFSVLVQVLGWFGRWLDLTSSASPSQRPGMLVWIAGPLILVLILRRFAGDGWKDFGLKPAFKGNLRWYFISIFIYPLCAILILFIGFKAELI